MKEKLEQLKNKKFFALRFDEEVFINESLEVVARDNFVITKLSEESNPIVVDELLKDAGL